MDVECAEDRVAADCADPLAGQERIRRLMAMSAHLEMA